MDHLGNPDSYMPDAAVRADIAGHIAAYNAERPVIHRRGQMRAAGFLGVFAMIAALALYATWGLDKKNTAAGLVGGLAIFLAYKLWDYAWAPVTEHRMTLRYALFPRLFGFIDDIRYSHGQEPGFLNDIKTMKLVAFSSSENDDLITGSHQGLRFELLEAKLVTGSGKNKHTAFAGLILHFRLDRPFPGMLIAAKRGGWMERTFQDMWRTGPSDDILSGNHRLDESHIFRSDNQAAARPIIAGVLTSVLTWLGNEWHQGEVRVALRDSSCFLLLPSKHDYFRLPDINSDIDYGRDVEPLVREMVMLLAVAQVIRKVG